MILFGATITGQEALSNGLVAELFPHGSVLDGAIRAAQQLASLGSLAVQLAKEAICRSKSAVRPPEPLQQNSRVQCLPPDRLGRRQVGPG